MKRNRILLISTAIILLSVAMLERPTSSRSPASFSNQIPQFEFNASPAPEPSAAGGQYYFIRQDFRRCASPLCGGYFVRRVNRPSTRCADRRWMPECYVAEIDWHGQPETEAQRALLKGDIVARRFPGFGNLGTLRVIESWQSSTEGAASGQLFRARDRGVRCITHPCLTHTASRLNSMLTKNIAGVDLAAGASGEMISEAAAAMTHPDGVMVAGYFAPVSGPGGRAHTLKAAKFYLRAGGPSSGPEPGVKRCRKTGCSSEVCSDRDVITTCIYRPEFACFQKAACERQANGECGFTQTPELLSCLARARHEWLAVRIVLR